MGKHIVAQRRGKGGLVYRSPSHRHIESSKLPPEGKYKVVDIVHAPGRNAPYVKLRSEGGKQFYQIAYLGAFVGEEVASGQSVETGYKPGTTATLGVLPDGMLIHNVESTPGDGGKFCRTAGSSAIIISHGEFVSVKLRSGKIRRFHPQCLATVGIVAGSGARDPPVLKAGNSVHFTRSRAKRPYSVRGVAMNAINHPHGGGNHQHVGRPSTVGFKAPPGRKVGRLSKKKSRLAR
ncbi:MAG: 50S ribosomal protein L2 [Candidatus Thermoplasmatota archaeon]|jgi:large subunit ribosomal protein L2|nr:50S ribosomal protein L2 [Candidatus Thermoplasmatota archaeon]